LEEEVTPFYRYLRPQRFNPRRVELVTMPKGGFCLRFEELPEGDLFFTYARCHPTDFFNKDVARVIADDRAAAARSDSRVLEQLRRLPWSQNTDLLVNAVIRRCRAIDVSSEHPLVQHYMSVEYADVADLLEKLYNNNLREERVCEAWKLANDGLWKMAYGEGNK
jgi:hypothetical protein